MTVGTSVCVWGGGSHISVYMCYVCILNICNYIFHIGICAMYRMFIFFGDVVGPCNIYECTETNGTRLKAIFPTLIIRMINRFSRF